MPPRCVASSCISSIVNRFGIAELLAEQCLGRSAQHSRSGLECRIRRPPSRGRCASSPHFSRNAGRSKLQTPDSKQAPSPRSSMTETEVKGPPTAQCRLRLVLGALVFGICLAFGSCDFDLPGFLTSPWRQIQVSTPSLPCQGRGSSDSVLLSAALPKKHGRGAQAQSQRPTRGRGVSAPQCAKAAVSLALLQGSACRSTFRRFDVPTF